MFPVADCLMDDGGVGNRDVRGIVGIGVVGCQGSGWGMSESCWWWCGYAVG